MRDKLAKLQNIDRRILYAAIFILCALPFIFPLRLPVSGTRESQLLFDTIEVTPKDKVIIVDSAWEAGSQGENKGQVEVIFEHCFRKRIPFVVVSFDITPRGPQFADQTINEVLERLNEEDKRTGQNRFSDISYGKDWVNLGYAKGNWQAMTLFAQNVRSVFKKDTRGYSVDDTEHLPLMQKLKDYRDIYLIHSVTYSPQEDWLSFVRAVYGTKISYGCAGIQSTTYYRYILSEQLTGMLVGVRGVAEYDALLHPDNLMDRRSKGTQLIVPQSFGHMVLIFAVIIGNVGYFAARKGNKKNDS